MNRRRWNLIKKDEPNYVKIFEELVQNFLESNSSPEFEQQLNVWRSDLTYVPHLIDCIQQTKKPNPLFYAALCIQFLLKKFNKRIDPSTIQDIFTGIVHRLNNYDDEIANFEPEQIEGSEPEQITKFQQEQISGFRVAKVNLLKSISLILVYFPDHFDQLHIFSPEDSKILFGFLFDEADSQTLIQPNDYTSQFSNIPEQHFKKVLKESEMSKEWLYLFKNCLHQTSEISNYGFLLDRLKEVPTTQELYAPFISVFDECISNEYSDYSKGSQNFLEHIFDIVLEMLKTLLTPPFDEIGISMASYLWCEILDYDPHFFADRGSSYGKLADDEMNAKFGRIDLFDFLYDSLGIFLEHGENHDDFYQIISVLSTTFPIIIKQSSRSYVQPILKILKTVLILIDQNPEYIESEELASLFYEISKTFDNLVIRAFFDDVVEQIAPSSLFCIASSNDTVKEKYAPQIASMILDQSNTFSDTIIFYFIRQCQEYFEDETENLIEYALDILDSLALAYDLEISKALISLTKNGLTFDEEKLQQICTLFKESDIENPEIVVNIFESLLNIMINVGEGSPIFPYLTEIISSKASSISLSFYDSKENEEYVLNVIVSFAEMALHLIDNVPTVPRPVFAFLNQLVSVFMNSIDFYNIIDHFDQINSDPDFIHQQICTFISTCIKADIIPDVVDWIGTALSKYPSSYHIKLLSDIIDQFPTDKTLEFVLNIGQCRDNQIIIETLRFLKQYIEKYYENFNSLFTEEYFLGALLSTDMAIVDLSLDCIRVIIENENRTNKIFFHNNHQTILHRITDGVFTGYSSEEIIKVIDIWVSIFQYHFTIPSVLFDYAMTKIGSETPELEDFRDSFYYEEDEDQNANSEDENQYANSEDENQYAKSDDEDQNAKSEENKIKENNKDQKVRSEIFKATLNLKSSLY